MPSIKVFLDSPKLKSLDDIKSNKNTICNEFQKDAKKIHKINEKKRLRETATITNKNEQRLTHFEIVLQILRAMLRL